MSGRPIVEHRLCRRHGLCLSVAPAVFTVGRDGRVRTEAAKGDQAATQARQAARLCPAQAIRVQPGD